MTINIAVTVTDDMADRVVQQNKSVKMGEIMEVLRTIILCGNNIPEPTTLLFNNWLEDPLFRGTFSNLPVGVTDQTLRNLILPKDGFTSLVKVRVPNTMDTYMEHYSLALILPILWDLKYSLE